MALDAQEAMAAHTGGFLLRLLDEMEEKRCPLLDREIAADPDDIAGGTVIELPAPKDGGF